MANLLSRIAETAKIDVCRLYPNACHEPLQDNFKLGKGRALESKWALLHLPKDIALYFIRTIWACVRFNKRPSIDLENKIIFIWQSNNQRTALMPVKNESGKTHSVGVLDHGQLDWARRRAQTHLVSCLYFPICVYRYWQSTGYAHKTFKLVFTDHLHAYGMYFYLLGRFQKQTPAALVVSNDHIQIPCIFVAAAQAVGVPSFYVQHACVTHKFPPLVADYALLDGIDAALKYQQAGQSDTRICLVGPTRLDGYTQSINHKTTVESIGVCFSNADQDEKIFELLDTIALLKDFRFVIRPHYGMRGILKKKIRDFAAKHGFEYSVHGDISALEFMRSIDLLVAGVSSITMEAAMLDLTLASYVTNSKQVDWYGFTDSGLVDPIDNPEDFRNFILSNRVNRKRSRKLVKYYVSSIDTAHDGCSALIAARIINSVASRNPEELIEELSFSQATTNQ